MDCPDCNAEMKLIKKDSNGKAIEPFWKCPDCKVEVDADTCSYCGAIIDEGGFSIDDKACCCCKAD